MTHKQSVIQVQNIHSAEDVFVEAFHERGGVLVAIVHEQSEESIKQLLTSQNLSMLRFVTERPNFLHKLLGGAEVLARAQTRCRNCLVAVRRHTVGWRGVRKVLVVLETDCSWNTWNIFSIEKP